MSTTSQSVRPSIWQLRTRLLNRMSARIVLAAAVLIAANARARSEDRVNSVTPVAVVSARSFDGLTTSAEKVLTTAGATTRADQLRNLLMVLNGLEGFDRSLPLGVLVCLPAGPYDDAKVEPQFIGFLPIDSMDRLKDSLSAIQAITLELHDEPDRWELRAGRTTIPIRIANGYAFIALRAELLDDPLPDVAELTAAHKDYDLALSFRRDGLPAELRDRAIAEIRHNLEKNAERDRPADAGEREMQAQLVKAVGWIFERGLRDLERATVGVRLSENSDRLGFAIAAEVEPQTPLADALAKVPANASQFGHASGGASPLAVSFGGMLAGDAHRFAIDTVSRLRRDVERRMQQDGTANGPAAAPIRQMLDAFEATVAAGRIDAGLVFDGVRPGAMLLLAATRLEHADETAVALADFLPLIAETPAVADLELDAVEVDGVSLHRLTLQEVRKQDEWLYGPDVGLYLGAGRDALWLALGGFEREEQLNALLGRNQSPDDAARASLLRLDVQLKPWLSPDSSGDERGPRWLQLAREAFNQGGDRLHLDLFVDGSELRLQGTLEEGYIRFAGAAWRARQQRSNSGRSPNLAAPVLPKP